LIKHLANTKLRRRKVSQVRRMGRGWRLDFRVPEGGPEVTERFEILICRKFRLKGWSTRPSNQKQGDVPGGRNVFGAPPGESAPWAPSTGTCSLRHLARALRPPWRRRTDAAEYHPAGSVRASGNCARNRVSRCKRSRVWCGTSWSGICRPSPS